MKVLTLTAYAARRGVSTKAVSKAVATNRLSKSVVRDKHGKPKIADPELADREWDANTRASIDVRGRVRQAVVSGDLDALRAVATDLGQAEAYREPTALIDGAGAAPSAYQAARALREEAATRRETAQAELAEIELAARRRDLVPTKEVHAFMVAKFTSVKTRLLAVPSRIAQRFPQAAKDIVPVVDDLIREALEELADSGNGDDQSPEAAS